MFAKLMMGLGGWIYAMALFAVVMLQSWAFIEGADLWFGIGWLLAVLIFVAVLVFVPLGAIGTAVVAYHGATVAWHWEWWQAALLCFPGLITMFFGTLEAHEAVDDFGHSFPSSQCPSSIMAPSAFLRLSAT